MTKCSVKQSDVVKFISSELKVIQDDLFKNAQNFQNKTQLKLTILREFKKVIDNTGGFSLCHWDGTPQTEKIIKEKPKQPFAVFQLSRMINLDFVFILENPHPEESSCKGLLKLNCMFVAININLHLVKILGPFVYRLGRQVFILVRGVRFPYGLQFKIKRQRT